MYGGGGAPFTPLQGESLNMYILGPAVYIKERVGVLEPYSVPPSSFRPPGCFWATALEPLSL